MNTCTHWQAAGSGTFSPRVTRRCGTTCAPRTRETRLRCTPTSTAAQVARASCAGGVSCGRRTTARRATSTWRSVRISSRGTQSSRLNATARGGNATKSEPVSRRRCPRSSAGTASASFGYGACRECASQWGSSSPRATSRAGSGQRLQSRMRKKWRPPPSHERLRACAEPFLEPISHFGAPLFADLPLGTYEIFDSAISSEFCASNSALFLWPVK